MEVSVRGKRYFVYTHDQQIIEPQNWTKSVSPRSKLGMAVFFYEETTDNKVYSQSALILRHRSWGGEITIDFPKMEDLGSWGMRW